LQIDTEEAGDELPFAAGFHLSRAAFNAPPKVAGAVIVFALARDSSSGC
jgi:hypothetical protein